MDPDARLPIKIVMPRESEFQPPDGGGGPAKVFGDVTAEVREALDYQVGEVEQHFRETFQRTSLPAVARVALKPTALAKSHRPTDLFNERTCPIIGVGGFGELYVSARPRGLQGLSHRIQHLNTKRGIANISTISEILPYTPEEVLGPQGIARIRQRLAEGDRVLKLRLFQHHQPPLDEALLQGFFEYSQTLDLPPPEPVHYVHGLRIFRIPEVRDDVVAPLAGYVGTQSLSPFPRYRIHHSASRPLGPLPLDDFPMPGPDDQYSHIGIVDTGIDPSNPCLAPWIIAREENVAQHERDYGHGTFVAGLAVHARRFNQHPKFPDTSARIVDIQALPGNQPLPEDELLTILEDVVPRYPSVKVWNLSLSADEPCQDQRFSHLAMALDEIQDRHGVTFVIAVGNYGQPPFRRWPPDDLGEADRLAPPADSTRAISVGSVAHLDRPSTRVRRDQPSPFSRRGPGPVSLPKPEVSHFGGNCDAAGRFIQTGVISTDGHSQLAEDIGTSFAAPLVATLLANVDQALLMDTSRNLAKALVVHSAVLGSGLLCAEDLNYRGFGVPGDLASVLTCSPWAATLIFETEILPQLDLACEHFPIPSCLRGPGGTVKGEFIMTLVYEPPLEPTYGAEYCRSNVEVSLGTYDVGKKGKQEHRSRVPPEPKDVSKMYERQLIEHGFKWSPVKVYRRMMQRVKGDEWRLKVSMHHRSGYTTIDPQEFALIVTMRDPNQQAPVYDEVVHQMQQIGWVTQDLQVHERVRARP